MRVPCDACADDDSRCDLESLVREIDRLDGLDALQLVDGQWVAIDTVTTERRASGPTMSHKQCVWFLGSCLLEASQLRHLYNRLCNALAAFFIQVIAGQTASKHHML